MIQLVIKDFKAGKVYLISTLLTLVLISIGFMLIRLTDDTPEVELYILVVLISCSITARLFILINESYQVDKQFISLPVSRNQMVKARYFSSLALIAISMIVHLTIVLTFGQFSQISNQTSLSILYEPTLWVILGLLLVIGNNLSYPFHFKFGFYMGSVISIFCQFILLVLIVFCAQFTSVQNLFNRLWEFIIHQHEALIIVVLVILFLFIACLIIGMFMIFVNTNLLKMFSSGSKSFIVTILFIAFIREIERRSTWTHLLSLPVSRSAMVKSKYILSILILSVNLAIWVISYQLIKGMFGIIEYEMTSAVVLTIWLNLLFHTGIFFFAFYRFNIIVTIGINVFSMLIPTVVLTITGHLKTQALPAFNNQFLILTILAFSIFVISYFSSLIHFKQKNI